MRQKINTRRSTNPYRCTTAHYFSSSCAYSAEPDGSIRKALCCRVSEAILLSFKEPNLLIELQIICVLLIGIFCSFPCFLGAEKCNKANCISTEQNSLYFVLGGDENSNEPLCSLCLFGSIKQKTHTSQEEVWQLCHLAELLLLNETFSEVWIKNYVLFHLKN